MYTSFELLIVARLRRSQKSQKGNIRPQHVQIGERLVNRWKIWRGHWTPSIIAGGSVTYSLSRRCLLLSLTDDGSTVRSNCAFCARPYK